jgi:hypothetical protein
MQRYIKFTNIKQNDPIFRIQSFAKPRPFDTTLPRVPSTFFSTSVASIYRKYPTNTGIDTLRTQFFGKRTMTTSSKRVIIKSETPTPEKPKREQNFFGMIDNLTKGILSYIIFSS